MVCRHCFSRPATILNMTIMKLRIPVWNGTVVDRKTNESLQAEAANSYKVEYYELSWEEAGHANTQSRFFWGKADGTFLNTKIFAGKYRITLKEGAFYAPEPEVVYLKDESFDPIGLFRYTLCSCEYR